jgi:hypothetical protein
MNENQNGPIRLLFSVSLRVDSPDIESLLTNWGILICSRNTEWISWFNCWLPGRLQPARAPRGEWHSAAAGDD